MALPNVAVPTAMDSLSQALRTNIIPNQEYLLQGSIIDSAVEHLLHRLKGLCDNVDTGPEQFHDHEICLSLRAPNQAVCISLIARFSFVPTKLKTTFYYRIHCCCAFARLKTSMHRTNCDTSGNRNWEIEHVRPSFVRVWTLLAPHR